jgi:3-oxoacyl-[acyl-carrier protein] reductase
VDLHSLAGKRALVCGSTQGIGRAAAIELASRGAAVTLFARDAGALGRVRAELPGKDHAYLVADFSDNASVKSVAAAEIRDRGAFHVLVNNTGGPPAGPIADASPDAFLDAFRAHLVNNQILAQAVIPGMKQSGYGRIVNIVSTSVREPIPGLGVSNTIRASVAGWAKTLAGELAPHGITVNNVLPGYTKTARLDSIIAGRAKASGRSVEDVTRDMLAQVPAKRFGDPREIAAAIGFLASPAGGYITGVSLPVDGGRIAAL